MTAISRPRVLIVFGGRSSEHEISCSTAAGILTAIDRTKWDVIPLGITRDGQWVRVADDPSALEFKDGKGQSVTAGSTRVALTPGEGNLVELTYEGDPDAPDSRVVGVEDLGHVDIVFPLLHGPYGEDGTIQGLCEMVGVPYTGCGVAASANGMDKEYAKILFERGGLPVGKYFSITDYAWRHRTNVVPDEVRSWGLPVFVKPARAGSSLGITRVTDWSQFEAAVEKARRHDPKVLIESGANHPREIECAVLEGRNGQAPRTTPPGEVVMMQTPDMYDFESNYFPHDAVQLQIPADIPAEVAARIQDMARRAFQLLGGEGLSRVDFFYLEASGQLILNEVNTMPGMTPFSLYPGMWANAGLSYRDLVTELIELALAHPQGLR